MSLQEKLAAISAGSVSRVPPETRAVMVKANADLAATGQAERALKVGDAMPAFTLPGPDGTPVSSAELLAKGPLVITFYRGVWCPYCNAELQALQDILPELQALGASLVAISPENAANSRKSVRQNELSFPILTDKGNELAHAFGLRFALSDELIAIYKGFGNDLAMVNGEPSWTLPMPGRYVVGQNGVVVYSEVNPDYTQRPEPALMMPSLKALAG